MLSQKKYLYDFFSSYKKLLLPETQCADLKFLLEVVEGKKKLLTQACINSLNIDFENISVQMKKLQKYCQANEKMKQYLPDNPANKDYLLKLLSVLDRETLDKLVEISNIRKNIGKFNREEALVRVSSEYAKLILAFPIIHICPPLMTEERLAKIKTEELDFGKPLKRFRRTN
jgi:hypothetical protein